MPNPKRRHSKARRDKRRAHDALAPPRQSICPNCGEVKLPHRACGHCGLLPRAAGDRGQGESVGIRLRS